MISIDTISNLFSSIVNGSKSKKYKIIQPKSKKIILILDALVKEGFIKGYTFFKNNPNSISIYLKYYENEPVITKIKRISKQGKQVFIKNKYLYSIKDMNSITYLLSTSKGIMTASQAKRYNIGGEFLCEIK
jgi:small subunit ribosomal protein S8